MPTRSRSHQVEDISILKFSTALPACWVVRRKEKDYGIDLEVEIFRSDGRATGLIFFVQLRGTDDPDKEKKISLKVEQVEYFFSLDIPTMIVRYCEPKSTLFCSWHFNLKSSSPLKEGQKSFTHHFAESERWTEETADAIYRTLSTKRLVDFYPAHLPISMKYDEGSLAPDERYAFDRTMHDLVAKSAGSLTLKDSEEGQLAVLVTVADGKLSLRLDCFASVTFELGDYLDDQLATSLQYGLVTLFGIVRLSHHAYTMARSILAAGRPHHSRAIAYKACRALALDLERSVELALLNGLHRQEDEFYPLYIMFLFRTQQAEEGRERAVRAFYERAIEAAADLSVDSVAAAHYSLGNFFRGRGRLLEALRCFNRARRLRPNYMTTDYFLRELGACMFGKTRYRCAAELYGQARSAEMTPRDHLHLGDALLFSGQITEAVGHFAKASSENEAFLKGEAALKHLLCGWLAEWIGAPLPTRRSEADARLELNGTDIAVCDEIIREIDATHEIAHYNLGVYRAGVGEIDRALGNFLMCAFKQSGDFDAWANAVICAYNLGEAEVIISVMACALSLGGNETYHRLRELLISQAAEAGLIEGLDQIFRELSRMVQTERSRDLTLRALREAQYDVVAHIQ